MSSMIASPFIMVMKNMNRVFMNTTMETTNDKNN
jgi:hypothetical protein